MAQWEGRSKGLVIGYKVFIFFIKHSGSLREPMFPPSSSNTKFLCPL